METVELREALRNLFSDTFGATEIEDGTDIFSEGFGNSLFALQLVEFVEGRSGVTFEAEDLDIAHFRSIDSIAGLVDRKLAVEAGR